MEAGQTAAGSPQTGPQQERVEGDAGHHGKEWRRTDDTSLPMKCQKTRASQAGLLWWGMASRAPSGKSSGQ